jgi:ligand-binding sensor domain-containing protein
MRETLQAGAFEATLTAIAAENQGAPTAVAGSLDPPTTTPAQQAAPLILGGDAAKVSDLAVLGGYVWAATEGGLVRWSADGAYQRYPGSDLGFPDDCINAIVARLSDNTLWLGCGGVAVVRVQGDQLELQNHYNRDDGLGMGTVRALAVDPNDLIWAGGAPDEDRPVPLSVFTGQNEDEPWQAPEQLFGTVINASDLPPIRVDINSIYISPEYNVLLGMKQDGILFIVEGVGYYFGEDQGVGRPGLLDRRIRRLLIDRNGSAWAAASDQGLLVSGPGESEWRAIEVVPGGAPVRTVAEFPDGSLWAAGDRLVVRSDDGGESWTQVGTQDGLGNDIGALVQDDAGQVWAGAYTGGVSVWDGQRWHALQQ